MGQLNDQNDPSYQAADDSNRQLDIRERVSIVNSLMTQDRIEVRERQEAVFKLTYYVIPGFIAFAAFSVAQPSLKWKICAFQCLLLVLFTAVFVSFRIWLADARECLNRRELYFKNQALLFADPFEPIMNVKRVPKPASAEKEDSIKDTHLLFPFYIVLAFAAASIAFVALN